ncbi:DUF2197 domain-containing protein [Halalkalibacillus sediminis]|uniref:DUF2197 domain-containing protein n=1 Tax=Halalkalibacillus sediminis TaxID=2018042 RepID=A0A2I0QVX6_9BACI|nr:DUF2197 domain-containing protein [Halalkalibacillus sediminis]PKR78492.1 DUF2197 domain-containing protein [Halalkalibacillus sediminis]
MRVKCVLCDNVEKIESFSLEAKQLRKRRKQTYLCPNCYERIGKQIVEKKSRN